MSGKVEAPKKFVVTKVSIRREASVSTYLKQSASAADLKKLLAGVAKMGNWGMKIKDGVVIGAWPTVDGHPGHIDAKDWKLNIEKGNGSVDRLFLKKRKYDATKINKSDPNTRNVEISCAAFVVTNTH